MHCTGTQRCSPPTGAADAPLRPFQGRNLCKVCCLATIIAHMDAQGIFKSQRQMLLHPWSDLVLSVLPKETSTLRVKTEQAAVIGEWCNAPLRSYTCWKYIFVFLHFVTNTKHVLISSYCIPLWLLSIITEAYSILQMLPTCFKKKTAESTVGGQSQVSERQKKIITILIFSIKRKIKLKRISSFS